MLLMLLQLFVPDAPREARNQEKRVISVINCVRIYTVCVF